MTNTALIFAFNLGILVVVLLLAVQISARPAISSVDTNKSAVDAEEYSRGLQKLLADAIRSKPFASKHSLAIMRFRNCLMHKNCSQDDYGAIATPATHNSASPGTDHKCQFVHSEMEFTLSGCDSTKLPVNNCSQPVPGSDPHCSRCQPAPTFVDIFFTCDETGSITRKARTVKVHSDCHCE